MRSIECGDLVFTAVIAQTDAFDLSTRKGFNIPISFVHLTIINRGAAPITADFKLDKTIAPNGENAGFVFFPSGKTPGYTVRWNAPNGDVLVLTAPEWKR